MTTLNKLRPYQEIGRDFVKSRRSVLLADQPGLGKTIQTIAGLQNTESMNNLVLAPKSMIGTWGREIKIWDSDAEVVFLEGSGEQKKLLLQRHYSPMPKRRMYYVTNWETLIQNVPLQAVTWGAVVGDEIHRIKNRNTKTAKALKKLKTVRRIGLSGTPFINRADELWSILNWLDTKRWSSYWRYYETYLEYSNTQWGKQITGLKYGGKLLEKDISPWVLRRLKSQVLTELPPKQYQYLSSAISKMQYQLYLTLKKEFLAELNETTVYAFGTLAQITRFRQLVVSPALLDSSFPDDSPRLDGIAEHIMDMTENVVVFSEFVGTAELLKKRLKDKKVYIYNGSLSNAEREKILIDFQKERDNAVFIGTISSAGVGITLHNASTVIFCDRSYSPAKNEQCEDRLHRLGQRNAVNVLIYYIPNTVDVKVEKILLTKKQEFNKVMISDMIGIPPKPGELVIE